MPKKSKPKVKLKAREITLKQSKGVFSLLKTSKKPYDFSGISELRQLLSNEKARILYVIKTQEPNSIYALARELNRNFKSVSEDIKILEKFGFIRLIPEKTKNRRRFYPKIMVDEILVRVRI